MPRTVNAATPEPPPQDSKHIDIADLVENDILLLTGSNAVAVDIRDRKAKGVEKYGTPLRAFNGRNAFMDLYQELVDAANYLRQAIYEKTRYGGLRVEIDPLREDYYAILRMMVRYRREAEMTR